MGKHKNIFTALMICLFPILLLWIYKCLVYPRPYWAGLFEPEMGWFMNSVEIARGHWPQLYQHPGTPIILLGGVLSTIFNINLTDVQLFLRIYYIVGIIIFIYSLFLYSFFVLRTTSIILISTCVLMLFCTPTCLFYLNVLAPELFALSFGCIFMALFWRANSRQNVKWLALSGLVLGFSCALKILFITWLVGGIICIILVYRNLAIKRNTAIAAWLACVITGFSVATIPIMDKYYQVGLWIWSMISHKGSYGDATSGSLNYHEIFSRFWVIVSHIKTWLALVLINMVITYYFMWRRNDLSDDRFRLYLGLSACATLNLFLGILVTTLQPFSDYHYVIETGPAVLLLFSVSAYLWMERANRLTRIALLIIITGYFLKSISLDIKEHNNYITTAATQRQLLDQYINDNYKDTNIVNVNYAWCFPRESYALRNGDAYAGGVFAREIHDMFPKDGIIYSRIDMRESKTKNNWDLTVFTHQFLSELSKSNDKYNIITNGNIYIVENMNGNIENHK